MKNIKKKTQRIQTDNVEDLAYDYRVQCRKIWRIVTDAISKGIDKYSNILSKEEIKELQLVIIEPQQIEKKDIDNAIKVAKTILVKHEIFPA